MASKPPRRRVLIIEDEPSIRNILYVLLAGIGCDAETATSGTQALALVEREKFDALLLDLRCLNVKPEEVVGGVQRIRPSLIGRVLAVRCRRLRLLRRRQPEQRVDRGRCGA